MSISSAIRSLRERLGDENVLDDDDSLLAYTDPFSLKRNARSAVGVARPASVEEVQAVLEIANRNNVPLWTVSTGKNLGYGGAAPRQPGSIVVELSRMNRILEVDEDLGYALLEPGVQFFDLYKHLRQENYRLWASVPGLGWGSVIGNALERGFGQAPYGEHSAMVCGMEVVLANGSVVRTGMGALSNATAWQVYKGGYGPHLDGLFMQSNFGIVTKMGIWLMPEPEAFSVYDISFRRNEDLLPMVEALRPLKLKEVIQGSARASNSLRTAQQLTTRDQWFEGNGPMPEEAIDRMVDGLGIGRWNLRLATVGHHSVIAARDNIVKDAFSHIEGSEISSTLYPGDVSEADILPSHKLQAGIPNMESLKILDWRRGNLGHIGFAPLSPLRGRDVLQQSVMVKARLEEHGFDYNAGITAGTRHLNHIVMILFDIDNEEETRRVRDLYTALVTEGAAAGYGEYRAHLDFMDHIAEQYSFNDHALMRVNETIKDALDPNGILSPGKQGIWPSHLRAPTPGGQSEHIERPDDSRP